MIGRFIRKNSQRGEIASIIALIGLGIVTVGIIAGRQLVKQGPRDLPRAEDRGCLFRETGETLCNGNNAYCIQYIYYKNPNSQYACDQKGATFWSCSDPNDTRCTGSPTKPPGDNNPTATAAPNPTPDKTCSITLSKNQVTNGESTNLTLSGNANSAATEPVRLFIEKQDYTKISTPKITPAATEWSGDVDGDGDLDYFYRITGAECSTDGTQCSTTKAITVMNNDVFYFHCDLAQDPGKCSGSPICTFNGGSTTCTGWTDCSANDLKTLTVTAVSITPTPSPTLTSTLTPVPAICGPSNCSGCCYLNTCFTGNALLRCGKDGNTCDICMTYETCTEGVCVNLPTKTPTPTPTPGNSQCLAPVLSQIRLPCTSPNPDGVRTAQYSWAAISGATEYELQLSDLNSGGSGFNPPDRIIKTAETSMNQELPYNTTWYARVRVSQSNNSCVVPSNWSNIPGGISGGCPKITAPPTSLTPTRTPTPTPTITPTPLPGVCTDSDGGKNYYLNGRTTNVLNGSVLIPEWDDVCLKDRQGALSWQVNYLFEGYCDSSGIGRIESRNCPDGCESGVCVGGVTTTPSVTPTRTPTTTRCIRGPRGNLDCSLDGCIDTADFELFRQAFGLPVSQINISSGHYTPDLIQDAGNLIDTADYEILRSNFGSCSQGI